MLRKYVREKELIQLSDALRKMTSFPAQRLGIHNRGILAEGMWADITLFHPQKIKDTANYTPPEKTRQYPQGIPFVLVNGQIVINQGEHTGSLPGKILKRKDT